MNTYCFVRPEHLSHHGFLFGGQLLKWVDEYAWLVAALDFPNNILVTRAMDTIKFTKRVPSGAILRFEIIYDTQGVSSVTYNVKVFKLAQLNTTEELVFTTRITFVSIDQNGVKTTLPKLKTIPSERDRDKTIGLVNESV